MAKRAGIIRVRTGTAGGQRRIDVEVKQKRKVVWKGLKEYIIKAKNRNPGFKERKLLLERNEN